MGPWDTSPLLENPCFSGPQISDEPPKLLGKSDWLRSSVSGSKTHERGEISTRLYFAEGRKCSKNAHKEGRPPYVAVPQSPSHWSGQDARSSRLANLKQIVTGRRGKEEGGGGCLRQSRNKME